MARYSARYQGAADFVLSTVFQLITGFEFTRHFDDGELLILYNSRCSNPLAVQTQVIWRCFVAGILHRGSTTTAVVPAGLETNATCAWLQPVSAGPVTVRLECTATPAAGPLLDAFRTSLVVIQLPLWDSEADIVLLP